MSAVHQLGVQLIADLESFLAELRNDERIKKWLDKSGFSSMYESYESTVRLRLAETIQRYELEAARAESMEEDFRNAVVITVEETLKQYLISFQQIMKSSANTMVRAFEATQRQ